MLKSKIFLLIPILIIISCQQEEKNMTEEQSAAIKETVKSLFQSCFSAAEQADVEKGFADFDFEDIYNVGYIDNGKFYTSFDSLYAHFKAGFSQIQSQDINVAETRVAVLAPNVALLTTHGSFTATGKNGDKWSFPVANTFVAAKLGNQWKFIHTHQSFVH